MTQDEIICMGLEAGMRFYCDSWTVEDDPDSKNPKQISTLHLQRFAKLVAQHERDACATVCDEVLANDWEGKLICASAIRARGQA